jgi:hypothetical protein
VREGVGLKRPGKCSIPGCSHPPATKLAYSEGARGLLKSYPTVDPFIWICLHHQTELERMGYEAA